MKERSDWLLVAVLFAATLVVESVSWNQLVAYTPLFLREMHVPADEAPGWIAAFSSVGWILALPLAPFWGVLADRYSRKLIIVRSAAVEAVIFAGWAFATTPWVALAFVCLNGFVLGNTGVMLAVQASTTPAQRLAVAIGIVGAGSPAGRTVGPILGAVLVHLVDVRGMLLFNAALSASMAVLLSVLVRERDHVRPADVRVLSLLRGALTEIVSRPLLWRLFLAMTVAYVGSLAMLPYVPLYIIKLAPANPVTAIGVVLSLVGLGAALASPAWGAIMQRFGYVAVLGVASAGGCVALIAAGASHTLPVFAAFLVVNAVFAAAILTATMAVMAVTVTPERRGAVLGQIMFPFYVGGIIGPPIGNLAFHVGQGAVFGVAAVLSLAPLVVMLTLRPAVAQTRAA
ncbi:MAG TPA: MFS transporter [Candidatus Dormibacteraeota bacterium]|nr:MFS transporter [Candidatus Dormibacteraeota bacterium]